MLLKTLDIYKMFTWYISMSDENILISEIIDTTFDNNDYTCPIGPQSVYIPTTGPTGPTGPPCENVISFPTFINAYSTSEQKI